LGTSSPKIIVAAVARTESGGHRDRRNQRLGKSNRGERPFEQSRDGWFGEEPDSQVRQGDPDLGAGELGRQRAQRARHTGGRPRSPRSGRRNRRAVHRQKKRTQRPRTRRTGQPRLPRPTALAKPSWILLPFARVPVAWRSLAALHWFTGRHAAVDPAPVAPN